MSADARATASTGADVHIRQQIARKRGNGFYKVQYSAAENGSRTLCGAAPTDQDMAWGEARFPRNLAYVTCGRCKELRNAHQAPGGAR